MCAEGWPFSGQQIRDSDEAVICDITHAGVPGSGRGSGVQCAAGGGRWRGGAAPPACKGGGNPESGRCCCGGGDGWRAAQVRSWMRLAAPKDTLSVATRPALPYFRQTMPQLVLVALFRD